LRPDGYKPQPYWCTWFSFITHVCNTSAWLGATNQHQLLHVLNVLHLARHLLLLLPLLPLLLPSSVTWWPQHPAALQLLPVVALTWPVAGELTREQRLQGTKDAAACSTQHIAHSTAHQAQPVTLMYRHVRCGTARAAPPRNQIYCSTQPCKGIHPSYSQA
jgi:hypothetical protein